MASAATLRTLDLLRGPMTFTFEEFCTILAALRVFQAMPMAQRQQMDHFDDCEPLTNEQIDALCERIFFDEVVDAEDRPL
jgi:hypothetical protein